MKIGHAAMALALLTAAAPIHCAAAAPPDAIAAAFDGEVRVSADAALLTFSGVATVSSNDMRIDVLQHELGESVNIIVDFDAGSLVALYPDTLNGARYKLEEFDYIGGFSRIRDALLGKQPHAPEDWEESAGEQVELDSLPAIKRQASSTAGLAVTWWTSPDGQPRRIEARKQDTLVIIQVSSYESLAELDPSLFAIPEDYTITAAEDDIPEGMPPL